MGKLHVRRIDRGEIHLPTFAVALTIPGRRRGTKMDMIGSQFESDGHRLEDVAMNIFM
jgi:hypothetical protein